MDATLALIQRAHQGDKEARDTIFKENVGLIWSIVKRFTNRGVDTEDLFQIGSIGLLKAVDNFNLEYEVKFSTYAVPMISGEIKRFLRDDGMLKVSRSMKEISYKAYMTRESMEKRLGREPTMMEISDELGISNEELVMAMDAAADVESLQKTIYQGDGSDISLMDKIPEKESRHDHVLDQIMLEEMLRYLDQEERQLIFMRYFQDKTQAQIAKTMGTSQVQISRMEKKILKKMRDGVEKKREVTQSLRGKKFSQ